jgi:hypothetical protein
METTAQTIISIRGPTDPKNIPTSAQEMISPLNRCHRAED